MSPSNVTIAAGNWVLVTGATGYVAANVVQEFLERGYKVRGTVRDPKSAAWLLDEDHFKVQHDRGDFEIVQVADLAADGAFDTAVKGVSAIAHVATVTELDPDPSKVIPQTVAGVNNVLEAALKEKSVQEIVFTGSSSSSTSFAPGDTTHVGRDTWNDASIKAAYGPPPYSPFHVWFTYSASKAKSEKAVWKFAEERKPHFTVNVVSPAGIIGRPLHKKHAESQVNYVRWNYNGEMEMLGVMPPAAYYVDVKDVALAHVASILDPEVRNARYQNWGHPANWNDFLGVLRKLRPDREFIADFPENHKISVTTDQSEIVALLKKWGNQDGYRSLESAISDAIDNKYFNYE